MFHRHEWEKNKAGRCKYESREKEGGDVCAWGEGGEGRGMWLTYGRDSTYLPLCNSLSDPRKGVLNTHAESQFAVNILFLIPTYRQ